MSTDPKQGAPAYENWLAWNESPDVDVIFEWQIYSDADLVPELRENLGPYQVLRTVREIPSLVDCPSLILRIKRARWIDKTPTGDNIPEELASLLALVSGSRLSAARGYSRRFGFDNDPLGQPIATSEALIVPKPVLGEVALSSVLGPREWDPTPLHRYPELTPEQSTAVSKAARLYRLAIWHAEAQPDFGWLMLVSATETCAGFWKKHHAPPTDRFRESKPDLAAHLQAVGGDALLDRVATDMADFMGSTNKFVTFLSTFAPEATATLDRKVLKSIYAARSQALHAGAPMPRPMPISLNEFESIVRTALLGWWASLLPGGEESTPTIG